MVKGFMAALVEQKPADVPAFAREYFGDTELARRLGYDGWTRPATPVREPPHQLGLARLRVERWPNAGPSLHPHPKITPHQRAEPPPEEEMAGGGSYRAEAERVFKLCDVTSDGKLDLDELANMVGFP
jgi:hypothetical protein